MTFYNLLRIESAAGANGHVHYIDADEHPYLTYSEAWARFVKEREDELRRAVEAEVRQSLLEDTYSSASREPPVESKPQKRAVRKVTAGLGERRF